MQLTPNDMIVVQNILATLRFPQRGRVSAGCFFMRADFLWIDENKYQHQDEEYRHYKRLLDYLVRKGILDKGKTMPIEGETYVLSELGIEIEDSHGGFQQYLIYEAAIEKKNEAKEELEAEALRSGISNNQFTFYISWIGLVVAAFGAVHTATNSLVLAIAVGVVTALAVFIGHKYSASKAMKMTSKTTWIIRSMLTPLWV
ncbi:hypothetical protein D770_20460 [Flammeovirgaceae bacterium 311]|nr:hypothetical protein D770_20460 [Flammeovirgaceae bacterium 311]